MKRYFRKKLTALLIASCLALGCFACLAGCDSVGKSSDAVPVQSVEMIMGAGNTGVVDRMSGKVTSSNTLEIFKKTDQKVVELNVKVGDEVKKGDVLFSYDEESLKLAYEKLVLEKEQYENLVKTIKQRIESLKKASGKGSEAEKLQNSVELQTAQIELREAEYSLTDMDSKIEDAEELLDNADYVSEIDGRVQSVNDSELGETDSTKPYITIVETGTFRVEGRINELNISSINEGDRVVVRSRADSHAVWFGEITQIELDKPESTSNNDAMYDGGSSDSMTQTSSYPFYVTLDDAKGLILGQHVFVEPDVGQCDEREGVWLPSFYICDIDSAPYVWKSGARDRLTKQPVQLGLYDQESDSYEISSGVEMEDYLAFPDESCVEGAKTQPYSEDSFNAGDDEFFMDGDGFEGMDGGEFGEMEGFAEDGGLDDMQAMDGGEEALG